MTRERLTIEKWEDIEGYEGFYQVSNLGRVKSLERITTYLWHGNIVERKETAKYIRGLYTENEHITQRDLSKVFNVSVGTIWNIINFKTKKYA